MKDQTLTVSLRVDAGIAETAEYADIMEPGENRAAVERRGSQVTVRTMGSARLSSEAALELGAALLRAGVDANLYAAFNVVDGES